MAKFLIEYELKANISNFNKEAARAGKKGTELNKAIDTSLQGINAIAKDRGLEDYFLRANKAAQKLKEQIKELDRLEKLKKPGVNRVELARQSVGAGKLEYAAEIAAANRAISESMQPATLDDKPIANLVRARYALYDLANEARRVGTAMTGMSLAVVKVGADFQRSFVDVERTTGVLGKELEDLRKSLVEISTSTSVSFGSVADLATLAAQMGIEGANVAEFSETVAKFSAVTGVTVEMAAQSLGRIAQLLKVNADEYDNLASSILFAGRNAVATEAEILSVTTQIAASAEQAGFLASEAVGLGTALASLRIQPEQARGVILRLFADFDKAMARNGKELADYAAILGMTTEETTKLYDKGGPEFFVQLTKALGDAQTAGKDMNVVLGQIGITNTREINVLERLVGNHDLLVKSLEDATSAYRENTDLGTQFDKVMATLTEQLKRFQNNLAALADAAARFGPGIDLLTGALTGVNDVLEYISKNEFAAFMLALGAATTLAAGVFILYKSALMQATATAFAAKTMFAELGAVGGIASLSIRNLVGSLLNLTPAAGAAHVSIRQITGALAAGTVGARAFGLAIKAIPFVAVGSLIIMAAEQMINLKSATEKAKESLEDFKYEISETENLGDLDIFEKSFAGFSQFENYVNGAVHALDKLNAAGDTTSAVEGIPFIEEINKAIDDLLQDGNLEKAGELISEVRTRATEMGLSTDEINRIFPTLVLNSDKVKVALDGIAETAAADELRDVAAAIKEDLTDALIAPDKGIANFLVATETFLQSLKNSKNGIDVFTEDGRDAFEGFEGIIDAIIEKSGTDLAQALMGSAAAIEIVERAGGDASSQIAGLVEELNKNYGIKLDPTTFSTLDQLRQAILQTAGVSAAARAEISNLLSGGEFTEIFSSLFDALQSSISDTATAVRQEVRTVFDYVGELRGLFNNITELAFASQVATDNSRDGWESITRSVNSARKAVIDIKKELAESATDRTSLENQLDIAKRYGDINEIRRITAEIESLDARVAASQEELAYQEGLASLTLQGNTRAARENRAEIRARVDESKALITAYAQTAKANGKLPTAAEVKAYARRIASDFATQAQAIGFSASELTQYTDVIRGFGTAAGSVTPPNIDVNINPITTAVEAYLAKKKKTEVTIDGNTSSLRNKIRDLEKQLKDLLAKTQPPRRKIIVDPSDVKLYRRGLEQGLISFRNFTRIVYGETLPLHGSADTMERLLMATGGYVAGPGSATSDSIPAMLSNGEYVIKAAAVDRYGVGFFDSLNQMKSGTAAPRPAVTQQSGGSSAIVYLSEQDRLLLRKAIDRPISLYTTDRKIAESANAGNRELARRGSR